MGISGAAAGKPVPFNGIFMGAGRLETRTEIFHGTSENAVFLWLEINVFIPD